MFEFLFSPLFWVGLGQIIVVDIVLSGDNAVVIALASRQLPPHQQKLAIIWGTVAAVALRVTLTCFAIKMLNLPYLKVIGSLLLFWIAVKLLTPENEDEDRIESSSNLLAAIRTIVIADLVMSLDNVIGIAAVAKGDVLLLVLGLAISIPLMICSSAIILKLMDRFSFIIIAGAALLGWVAGEMLVTDPILRGWIAANIPWMEIHLPLLGKFSWAQIIGAVFVVMAGRLITARAAKSESKLVDVADVMSAEVEPSSTAIGSQTMLNILLPVDGSENSLHAVRFVIGKTPLYKVPLGIHLLNVQHPFPGSVRGVREQAEHFHHDEGIKALEAARQLLDAAGVAYTYHIGVGDFGETIAHYTRELKIEQIVMGCRGASPVANVLIGSVSTKVLHLVDVPVTLVK